MAYAHFTLEQISKTFALTIGEGHDLFAAAPRVEASALLSGYLEHTVPLALAIATEKAKSELIIAPILVELRHHLNNQISLFSGVEFPVAPDQGLNGVCDFLISRSRQQIYLSCPVVALVEAKNDSIKSGLAQCMAEMIAARMFNEREGSGVEIVYGAVTSGSQWKFLKLQSDTLFVDVRDYFIDNLPKILGILVEMVSEKGTGEIG
ncbi:MAG: hypothetical protein HC884_17335 [Chloroflexaceae bacterium]|nr:hypothetical protein [Chloroflexaceae bacterium]